MDTAVKDAAVHIRQPEEWELRLGSLVELDSTLSDRIDHSLIRVSGYTQVDFVQCEVGAFKAAQSNIELAY